jgi:hypothetical protein
LCVAVNALLGAASAQPEGVAPAGRSGFSDTRCGMES